MNLTYRCILLFFLIVSVKTVGAQDDQIRSNGGAWEDSLRISLRALSAYTKIEDKLNEAIILKRIGDHYFEAGIYKKAAQYFEQEHALYSESEIELKALSAEMAARSYFYLPSDSLSSKWYSAASAYYESENNMISVLRCGEKLGLLLARMAKYDQAYNEFQKLLKAYLTDNDFKNAASVYNQVGFLLFKKEEYLRALESFRSAVEFSGKAGKDEYFLTDAWSNMAICHQNSGNQQEMLRSFEQALKHAVSAGRYDEVARINRIIAVTYFRNGDTYHAEMYCQNCIDAAKKSENLEVLQLCYFDYSDILEAGNDFIKALEYYEKHLNLRDSLNYANRLEEMAKADRLAEYESLEQRIREELSDEEIRDLELKTLKAESERRENEVKLLQNERALEKSESERQAQSFALEKERLELGRREQEVMTLKQQQLIDSLSLRQKEDEAAALESANQLLEKDKLQKETELRNEKLAKQLSMGLGLLMVVVAVFVLAGLISTRKKNLKLAESKRQIEKINADLEVKNTEVLRQKDIIEQKNQSITDSIQYASRIQEAVLPPANFISEWGMENFILFKPKDIVSGDFYWGKKKNEKIIIAAADCTGHGVPGAFMSMLGNAFLDEIVNTRNAFNAAEILNYLRDEIINTLKQKGTAGETRDGMDISLCIIDTKAGKLDFAGANNPLYLIRNGKLTKFLADKMPIGIHFISFTPFTNHSVNIFKNDIIYLFSDGYADQFGGPRGRKLMYKTFQEILLNNHEKPMEMQKAILDREFENWKGDRDQVDDVLVVGIRI